ncbi:MAG: OmpA family protein, partial [Prevotella fusca]
MKKLVLMLAAASMAASVSAQTVSESKTFDNIYVGLNGGVATKTTGHKWLSDLDPNAGVRVGRYFTPVFGLAVEGNAYFSNKPWGSTGTVVRATNVSLLGTVNLSNWFGGYQGEPRTFEVSALYGLGWGHVFTNNKEVKNLTSEQRNRMTSKAALDFAFNFGSEKQFQFYVEPSIN